MLMLECPLSHYWTSPLTMVKCNSRSAAILFAQCIKMCVEITYYFTIKVSCKEIFFQNLINTHQKHTNIYTKLKLKPYTLLHNTYHIHTYHQTYTHTNKQNLASLLAIKILLPGYFFLHKTGLWRRDAEMKQNIYETLRTLMFTICEKIVLH